MTRAAEFNIGVMEIKAVYSAFFSFHGILRMGSSHVTYTQFGRREFESP